MKDTILEKDTISVTINEDHSYKCTVVTLGRTGENAISRLEITIPKALNSFWAYLDFKKTSGKKFKTPRLNVVNNKIEYEIPQGLLDESGNLEVQLVLQNENGEIWKSAIKKYVVLKSIDAGDDIPEPENFITEAQKILDETQKVVDEAVETTESFITEAQKVLDKTTETTESFITEANAILSQFPEKREVDPVFANNSWETIKWVCQHDDPSKYWKVGDYKEIYFLTDNNTGKPLKNAEIGYTPVKAVYNINTKVFMEQPFFINKSVGYYRVVLFFMHYAKDGYNVPVFKCVLCFREKEDDKWEYTENMPFGYPYWFEDVEKWGYIKDIDVFETRLKEIGIDMKVNREAIKPKPLTGDDITEGYVIGPEMAGSSFEFKFLPLQIIGFNHDKVTDPYNYGKQKAGLTLQLGASRNFYGDTKPSVYEGVIDGLMEADGIHFKVPNKVLSDFTEGATNWADGGFRVALQSLFDGTEIAPYLTEVKKQTSHHYQEGQRWSALMDTADKVFLPSEWEYYGEVLYAPAREGDQYELYKEGYSKFMWSSELLSGAVTTGRLHFRSTVGSKVGTDLDSKYNSGAYLTVKSLDPVSVSYSHSYASGGGFIAPCICL